MSNKYIGSNFDDLLEEGIKISEKDIIQRLEAENEKLRKECMKMVDENYASTDWRELEKLKTENDELLKIIDCKNGTISTLKAENLRIEAENKKLIEENYELSVNQDDLEQYKTIIHNKNIDIERLKSENEALKQYKQSKQASYVTMQTEWNKAINESRDVKVENEKLKAENEELKEENAILKLITEPQREKIQKYRDKALQLKQTLEDVREITKKYYLSDKKLLATGIMINPYNAIIEIQNKINEVLGD